MNMFHRLSALLFPRRCPFCGRILKLGCTVCTGCQREIGTDREPFFLTVKGRQLPCYSPYSYEKEPRQAILNLKYHRAYDNALVFAEAISGCLAGQTFDYVICVPDAKRKHTPLSVLAKELARLEHARQIFPLKKARGIRRQHDLSMEERKKNVLHAYFPRTGMNLKGASCLLVDDVVTTGSTLSACASCLLEMGAGNLVLAAGTHTKRRKEELPFGQSA